MKIEIAPAARQQLYDLIAWWDANRPSARVRVEDAFDKALGMLEVNPELGHVYTRAPRYRVKGLKGTPYHLLYRVDAGAGMIYVAAVWGAKRGVMPELG